MNKSKPKTSIWKTWIPIVLGALPVVLFPSLNDPGYMPPWMVLAGLNLLGILALIYRKVRVPGVSRGVRLPLILTGIILISGLFGIPGAIDSGGALIKWLQFAVVLLSGFTLYSYLKAFPKTTFEILRRAVLIMVGVQAVLAFGQSAEIWGLGIPTGSGFPSGTLMNKNLLGSFLAIGLPFAGMSIWFGPKWEKVSAGVLIPLVLWGIWSSESRTALLILAFWGLISAPLLFLIFRERVQKKNLRIGLIAVGLGLFGLGYAVLYQGWGRKVMPSSYAPLISEAPVITREMPSAEVRMVLWNRTVDMIREQPLTGTGPGNWRYHIPKYGIVGFGPSGEYGLHFFLRPHNDWLQFAAEWGLIAGISWLIFWGISFLILIKNLLKKGDVGQKVLAGMLLLSLSGFFLASSFGFPGERAPHAFLGILSWVLAYSLSLAGKKTDSGEGAISMKKMWFFCGMGTLISLSFMVCAGIYVSKDPEIRKMRVARDAEKWEMVLSQANLSKSWFTRFDPVSATPLKWYEGMAFLQSGNPGDGLLALERARELAPHSFAVISNYAGALAFNGRWEEARDIYSGIVQKFDHYDEGWMNLAICHFQLGNFGECRSALEKIDASFRHPSLDQLNQALKSH